VVSQISTIKRKWKLLFMNVWGMQKSDFYREGLFKVYQGRQYKLNAGIFIEVEQRKYFGCVSGLRERVEVIGKPHQCMEEEN